MEDKVLAIRESLNHAKYHSDKDYFTISNRDVPEKEVDKFLFREKFFEVAGSILLFSMGLSPIVSIFLLDVSNTAILFCLLLGALSLLLLLVGNKFYENFEVDFSVHTRRGKHSLYYSELYALYRAGQVEDKSGDASSYRDFAEDSRVELNRILVLELLKSKGFITEEEHKKARSVTEAEEQYQNMQLTVSLRKKSGPTLKQKNYSREHFFSKKEDSTDSPYEMNSARLEIDPMGSLKEFLVSLKPSRA